MPSRQAARVCVLDFSFVVSADTPAASAPDPKIAVLIDKMLGGGGLALERLITQVENRTAAVPVIMRAVPATTRLQREEGVRYVAEELVGRDGIEPPTPGFSVLCSTN